MTMFESPPASSPPEIIGYVDPWIASPGSTIDVKVTHQKNNHMPCFEISLLSFVLPNYLLHHND